MKTVAVSVLLVAVVYVFGHPHEKIFELLCESHNEKAINATKYCMSLEPDQYIKDFDDCRKANDAEDDEQLCVPEKWDTVYNCAHVGYDHETEDYKNVKKCINRAYAAWKSGNF